MALTTAEQLKRRREENLRRLQGLRPIDDDFMRCLFKDNIPLAQMVLRIITGKEDLVIISCQTQKDMKRLAGARSICLDAYGVDSQGKRYDLEIQRADKGAEPHRARYHSSVMDVENLDAGQDFSELPDTYTIFIIEEDFYGQGKAVYPIERMNLATGKPFEDGEHILYVNGQYRGDSDIGRLMHDFGCTSADEMNYPLLADRTRHLKENPKGASEMCKIVEEIVKEEKKEAAEEFARKMLAAGKYSLEDIADILGLTVEEIRKLSNGKLA